MKSFCISVVAALVVFASFGQNGPTTFVASLSAEDRMSVVRTSIEVPAWHEKSFWPMYESYSGKMEEVAELSYRALNDFARMDKLAADGEAAESARKLIQHRWKELELLKEYYLQIGKEYNGVIALQFLQTEALLDMMESCGIYERTSWKAFRFHPKITSVEKFDQAKRNTMTKAFALTEEQSSKFWDIYSNYQYECNAVLGENYDMISVYAGPASDFTPAVAKRLGYNFLTIMERDIKLKEKYFLEFENELGSSVAARFLAWEDYYSLVSKMHTWAEQP
jgi:hypothetical protein